MNKSKRCNGGAGNDLASYTSFNATGEAKTIAELEAITGSDLAPTAHESEEVNGIVAVASGTAVTIHKIVGAGVVQYKETIESRKVPHGKRVEHIEYRNISQIATDEDSVVTDHLSRIEIFQGTESSDYLDFSRSTEVEQISGFDGDDTIIAGTATKYVLGGTGNDKIMLSESVFDELNADRNANNTLFISGGTGTDTVEVDSNFAKILASNYESFEIGQAVARGIAAAIDPAETQASNDLTELLQGFFDQGNQPLGNLLLQDMEYAKIDLVEATGRPAGAVVISDLVADVYNGVTLNGPSSAISDIQNWIANHDADYTNYGVDFKSEGVADDSIAQYTGSMFVEKGETYTFRIRSYDYDLLKIDGDVIASDTMWQYHREGSYTAKKTGYVSFEYIVAHPASAGSDHNGNVWIDAKVGSAEFQGFYIGNDDSIYRTEGLSGSGQRLVENSQFEDVSIKTLHNADTVIDNFASYLAKGADFDDFITRFQSQAEALSSGRITADQLDVDVAALVNGDVSKQADSRDTLMIGSSDPQTLTA